MSTRSNCPYCNAELPVGRAWRSARRFYVVLGRPIGLTCRECDRDVVLGERWAANLVAALLFIGGPVALAELQGHIERARGLEFSPVQETLFAAGGIGAIVCMIQVIPPLFLRARKPVSMEEVDMQE